MKGAIVSEEDRTAGNIVLIEINERSYDPEAVRVIQKAVALSGTVLTTDWGYPEGLREITVGNVLLSSSDYDLLVGMKEDGSFEFLFGYKQTLWKVVIKDVRGSYEGDKQLTTITLSVVSKYTDLENA